MYLLMYIIYFTTLLSSKIVLYNRTYLQSTARVNGIDDFKT